MKRAIGVLLAILLLTPPVGATQNLAPQKTQGDVEALVANGSLVAVAGNLEELRDEKSAAEYAGTQKEVERLLARAGAIPYWYSLVYKEDGSFEITVRYGEDNFVIYKFVPLREGEYYIEPVRNNVGIVTEQRELENILAALNNPERELPEGLLQKEPNPQGVLPQTQEVLAKVESLPARVTRKSYSAIAQVPIQNRLTAIYQALETQRLERLAPNAQAVRSWLGLNLQRAGAVIPAAVIQEEKKIGIPQALAYRRELMREAPKGSSLFYPYLAIQEETAQEALAVVKEARERRASPIKAVVVMGMGLESLQGRAVVQAVNPEGIKLVFVNNIANPDIWIEELKGIKPEEILLYISSEEKGVAEAVTMANFRFLWEWLIRSLDTKGVAQGLIERLGQAENIFNVNLIEELGFAAEERSLREEELEEKDLLVFTLNRMLITAPSEEGSSLYSFAVKNNIPIASYPARQILSTLTLPRSEIEGISKTMGPFAEVFKEENPEYNPALEAALYAYAGYKEGRPVLVTASLNKQLVPVFEWLQSLINERLGKQEKGPYLTFAAGQEAVNELVQAPEGKLFLVINVGEEKVQVPEGVAGIELNIPELNLQGLNRLSLFLEEFGIWYGALMGVNPVERPFVERIEGLLNKKISEFGTSPAAGKAGRELALTPEIPGTEAVQKGLMQKIKELAGNDQPLEGKVDVPETEAGFESLLGIANYSLPGELEELAQKAAIQLYIAARLGKSVNPFLIYSATPEAKLLGEFIKYLGNKRMARLKGGILWDVHYGITNQPVVQFLGAGTDIAITTLLHFLQETGHELPIIGGKGSAQEILNGKTPKEVSALYLESVREALKQEGRLVNTLEAPDEGKENLSRLYQLLVRTSELYSRLLEHERVSGETIGSLVEGNESVEIESGKPGVTVINKGRKMALVPAGLWGVSIPMQIAGLAAKTFIHPQVEGIAAEVTSSYNKFLSRSEVLAGVVTRLVGIKGSSLNRLAIAPELKEEEKPEIYAFKFEDVIAEVEVSELGDLYDEIKVKKANTLIAKTIQEIKRINRKAMVIVYSEEPQFKEEKYRYRLQAALDIVDAGGRVDHVVPGGHDKVLSEVVELGWVRDSIEARDRTVFASVKAGDGLKAVSVPEEGGFVPFPELATVMQALLRTKDESGKLDKDDIHNIIESYRVWLELAGIGSKDIEEYLRILERSYLMKGTNFVVSLPVPPTPKAGSVIRQLDKEYEQLTSSKGYA